MVYEGKLMVMDMVEEIRDTEYDMREKALRCFYRVFGHNHRKESLRRWRVTCFREKRKAALHDKAQILAKNTALYQELKSTRVGKETLATRLEEAHEKEASLRASMAIERAEWKAQLESSQAEIDKSQAAHKALTLELGEAQAAHRRELAELGMQVEEAFSSLHQGSEERLRGALAAVQRRERAELGRTQQY